jgi:hypothetical protein
VAAVSERNATSVAGNNTLQTLTLPTVLPGDLIVVGASFVQTGAITFSLSGAGTWTHQGTDSVIAGQLQMACYTAISTDGSESGATLNGNLSALLKLAMFAGSYSGVNLGNPVASVTYAQNTTSNTTSATSPSASPVPASMVLEAFTSKSTTNTSYTTPGGTSLRTSVFGTGGGAVDIMLVDSNGEVSSAGGHTTTESIATGNKIAMTVVLNTALARSLRVTQAVNRAAVI